MGYNSGYLARELGLGVEGTLPSSPDFPLVLHGDQTKTALEAILGKKVTEEDLLAAIDLANRNKNLDTFVKQTLAAGAGYGAEQQSKRNRTRLAGTALASAGGAAGLIALIQALQSPDKNTQPVLLQ
tara:strand:+ start:16620 stop:17000 length:381 start_codon:yes stop_codon:yes gene_type:complete